MKPFDLEAAKAGKPLITRDGRSARFIAHVPECKLERSVVAHIHNVGVVSTFDPFGRYNVDSETVGDLFMAPVKVTVYVNFYYDGWAFYHQSEATARHPSIYSAKCIAVAVPVEIEQ